MMHARSEKAPCSSKSMHMAALDSGATVHIVNSSSLEDDTKVEYAPTVIKTAHVGDTMHTMTCADLGLMKKVRIVEDDTLDMNLASVACFDKAGCRILW